MTKKTNKILIIFKSGATHSVIMTDTTLVKFKQCWWGVDGIEQKFKGETLDGNVFCVKFEDVDFWEVMQ